MSSDKYASMVEGNNISKKADLFLRNLAFLATNRGLIRRNKVPKSIMDEYFNELKKMNEIRLHSTMRYADNYDLISGSGLIVFSEIRTTRPSVVLETGVANGFSTRLMLAALNKNMKGILYSIEVSKHVGVLVKGISTDRWRLVVGKPRTALLSTLRKLKRVDIFVHDSDHSYTNMKFEFDAVRPKMRRGSMLMSDDVNANGAFMEFARSEHLTPRIIPSYRRCFGILKF